MCTYVVAILDGFGQMCGESSAIGSLPGEQTPVFEEFIDRFDEGIAEVDIAQGDFLLDVDAIPGNKLFDDLRMVLWASIYDEVDPGTRRLGMSLTQGSQAEAGAEAGGDPPGKNFARTIRELPQ